MGENPPELESGLRENCSADFSVSAPPFLIDNQAFENKLLEWRSDHISGGPHRLALLIDLGMTLLAQGQKSLPQRSVIGLLNQLIAVVLQLAGADRHGGDAGFGTLEP